MVAGGAVSVLTVTGFEVPEHPCAFVTVTVYVPGEVTLMDCVVAPFDQLYDPVMLGDNVTVSPLQIVVVPLACIETLTCGAIVTVREFDNKVPPVEFVPV